MTNLDSARIDCRRRVVSAWRPRRLSGTADAIRVLIVDRHAMLAHDLRAVLDEIEDFHVAGVAATPQFSETPTCRADRLHQRQACRPTASNGPCDV